MREDLNPFDTDIHSRLLKMIPQPVEKRHGFVDLRGEKLPNIRPHSNVMIGDSEFFCMECKGKLNFTSPKKCVPLTVNHTLQV